MTKLTSLPNNMVSEGTFSVPCVRDMKFSPERRIRMNTMGQRDGFCWYVPFALPYLLSTHLSSRGRLNDGPQRYPGHNFWNL